MQYETLFIFASLFFLVLFIIRVIGDYKNKKIIGNEKRVDRDRVSESIILIEDRQDYSAMKYISDIFKSVDQVSEIFKLNHYVFYILITITPLIISWLFIELIFLNVNFYFLVIVYIWMFVYIVHSVKSYRDKYFLNGFCDALILISQSISSGLGLVESISFSAENTKAKIVKDELNMLALDFDSGMSFDSMIEGALSRYRLSEYAFFLVNVHSSLIYGGEMKPVLNKIVKTIINNRNMDKKKAAMTSEARLSSRIVASLPLIFLVMMRYIREEDYEFIMLHPDGKWVFYYVFGSITIGLLINRILIRRVK